MPRGPSGAPLQPRRDEGDAEQRRLQMADIARLAGVSVSTVSRALNGSQLVNEKTRRRIAELAQSLNYSINLGAQNLRLQKNRTIAVVVPYERSSRQHISDPFFLAIVGALADALTARGYDMLLSRVDSSHLDHAAQLLDSGKAAGLVMIGQWHHHDQLNHLAARRLPIVVWGAELPRQLYCSVGGDNVRGGFLATRHLLDSGCRRIAFLGDASLPEVMRRREGRHDALRQAGLAADASLELALPFEVSASRSAMEAFFRQHADVDGVFACSDLLALQALQVLRALGRRVPDDVRVVGYDDMPIAMYSDPPLTSVHQPVAEAGEAIVEALMQLVDGAPVPPTTLPVRLELRGSAP